MTFSTNVPVAAQSPSQFPAQAVANWTNLKAQIVKDHVFNDTVVVGDNSGFHKIVHWNTQGGTINDGTPAANPAAGQTYTKTITQIRNNASVTVNALMHKNPNDTEFFLTPNIRVYVNFDGTTIDDSGNAYIRESINVVSVERIDQGIFRIHFAFSAGPTSIFNNNNYCVSGMAMADTSSAFSVPLAVSIRNRSNYSDAVDLFFVDIMVWSINSASSNKLKDPVACCINVVGF